MELLMITVMIQCHFQLHLTIRPSYNEVGTEGVKTQKAARRSGELSQKTAGRSHVDRRPPIYESPWTQKTARRGTTLKSAGRSHVDRGPPKSDSPLSQKTAS